MVKYFGFFLTYKCNSKCEHCFANAGPERTEELPVGDVLRWLDEIGPMRRISWISFVGGEPFLYDGLNDVVQRARQFNKKVRIFTNCFWATDLETAKKTLTQLKPTQLVVSADEFHQEFIPLENVKNAIRACYQLGIQIQVNKTGNASGDIGLDLYNEFGERLPIGNGPIVPMGRAVDFRNVKEPRSIDRAAKVGCPSQSKVVQLMVGGNVLSCCGIPAIADENTPMLLGNAYETSIEELIETAERDPSLTAIRSGNLSRLVAVVRMMGLEDKLRDNYRSGCDLCLHLMKDKEIRAAISEFYSRPGKRFYHVPVRLRTGTTIKFKVKETEFFNSSGKVIRGSRNMQKKRPSVTDLLNRALEDNIRFVYDSQTFDVKNKIFPLSVLGNEFEKILDVAYGPSWRDPTWAIL